MCDVRVCMCGGSVTVSGYVEYTIGTKSVVVLCPACVCFFARNGLVNEVKFLGLISQNSVISIRVSVPF